MSSFLTHEEADKQIMAAINPVEKKPDKAKIRETMIKVSNKNATKNNTTTKIK
jgi:hypothetical protein